MRAEFRPLNLPYIAGELHQLEIVLARYHQVVHVPNYCELIPGFCDFVCYARIVQIYYQPVFFKLFPQLLIDEEADWLASVRRVLSATSRTVPSSLSCPRCDRYHHLGQFPF